MKIYAATDVTDWGRYVGKDVWVKCCSGHKLSPFDDKYEPILWYIKALDIRDGFMVYYRIYAQDIDELMNNDLEFFQDDVLSIRHVLEGRVQTHLATLKSCEICTPVEILTTKDILDLLDNYEAQDQ